MERPREIVAFLEDYPQQAEDVVYAVIQALGLGALLEQVAEFTGDAGRVYPQVLDEPHALAASRR